MLTRPVGDRVRIDVVRGDGEIMYTGSAERIGPAIGFSVADVDRPGTAPTNVAGQVAEAGIELQLTVPFGTRVGTRQTAEVRAG